MMQSDPWRDRKPTEFFRRQYLIPGVVTIGLVGMLMYVRSDRRAIGIMVDRSIDAIESEDRALLSALISESYRDDFGYGRSDVLAIAQDFFDAFDDINVTVESEKIEIDGRHATMDVQFKVVVSYEGQRGYIAGAPQQAETIRLNLAREPPGWQVVRADHPRLHRGRK